MHLKKNQTTKWFIVSVLKTNELEEEYVDRNLEINDIIRPCK